ncbi:MAG: hypothetical protein IT525_13920 [Nitrosomonas sp.]|nr:hypothetical protein [Nitrosomonas sp.]
MSNEAFVAVMLGLSMKSDLIERLMFDCSLQHICGFPLYRKQPLESTFMQAFDEFFREKLVECIHGKLVKEHRDDILVWYISRDGACHS